MPSMNPIARVGLAVIGEAAIQETGDVGVVERGQHPAFGEKPLAKARRGEAGENELAGDRLLEAAGDAAAEVDGAHAAAAYEALQAVGAEGAAGVADGLGPVAADAARRRGLGHAFHGDGDSLGKSPYVSGRPPAFLVVGNRGRASFAL
jgi:hypothetical protein